MASWSSVHVHVEHCASRHRQIRLFQISTIGRPAISRSRTRTWRRFDEFYEQQLPLQRSVFTSNDAKEGPKAFAEKRAPDWTGT